MGVRGIQPGETPNPIAHGFGPAGKRPEDTVFRVNHLPAQGLELQHFFAHIRPASSLGGHLHIAHRRAHGLGSQTGEVQPQGDLLKGSIVVDKDPGLGVGRAKGVLTVEDPVGPPVPEVVDIEDGIDGRGVLRGVTRRILAPFTWKTESGSAVSWSWRFPWETPAN